MSNSDMQFKKSEWWKTLICALIAIGLIWVALNGAGLAKEKDDRIRQEEITTSKNLGSFGRTTQVLIVPNEAKDLIEDHEGNEDTVYNDTMGNPTIGIGFNLNREDAKSRISSLGLDYDSVLDGSTSLTDKQIKRLFERDYMLAVGRASYFLPTFNSQPKEIKIVLVNMAYNLGGEGLGEFVRFRQALLEKDYPKAANEMVDSKWYYQVGNRSKELVAMVREIPAK